ncbi:MAG: phospholipid carrier-dependent glycosyltransferase [Deltaproteobacteria bacterium]|jgi:hypothetical protein|nr:phospholipid carrier-dependent glycosyltransferase [Deltaproteobacteria bacterium]
MEILTFIPPVVIGFTLVLLVFPQLSLKGVLTLFAVCVGAGIGLGITSSTIFLWLAWIGRPGADYIAFEIGSAVLLSAISYHRCRNFRSDRQTDLTLTGATNEVSIKWLKILVIILLIISSGSFALKSFFEMPYGTVDVRIVWNYRARWLFKGGDQWKFAFFSPVARDAKYEDDAGHAADYPLLITGSVYRGWELSGKDRVAIPILIAAIFTFATYLLLYASLTMLRNRNQGYIAVLLLLVSTQFLHLGTDQYGDVPLAFFILATVVLFVLKDRFPAISSQALILAGFTASCAAWTKNEGLMFFALVIVVRFLGHIGRRSRSNLAREALSFLVGMLPIMATLVYYKIWFAPRNDMINIPTLKETVFHLFDLDRYRITLTMMLEKIVTFNECIIFLMAVYFFISGYDRSDNTKKHALTHVILLTLMMCGYLFAYVITPYELEWHIGSSIRRLYMQVWPAWVFLFFYCLKGPEFIGAKEQPEILSRKNLSSAQK